MSRSEHSKLLDLLNLFDSSPTSKFEDSSEFREGVFGLSASVLSKNGFLWTLFLKVESDWRLMIGWAKISALFRSFGIANFASLADFYPDYESSL